jgi:hypothetical protein
MVTANGGVMSKQAVGIYTATQPARGWSGDVAKGYAPQPVMLDDTPNGVGRVISFVRPANRDGFGPATVLVEMTQGQRAIAVIDNPGRNDLGDAVVQVTAGEKRHMATLA